VGKYDHIKKKNEEAQHEEVTLVSYSLVLKLWVHNLPREKGLCV
jgi:hypothetical protein